jgi:hypothetical protein
LAFLQGHPYLSAFASASIRSPVCVDVVESQDPIHVVEKRMDGHPLLHYVDGVLALDYVDADRRSGAEKCRNISFVFYLFFYKKNSIKSSGRKVK